MLICFFYGDKEIRNKRGYLGDVCSKSTIDIFLYWRNQNWFLFPDAQFHIEGSLFPPLRKDHNQNGGGKIVYIKEGIITKRLIDLEGK